MVVHNMQMPVPNAPHTAHELTVYNGVTRTVYVTGREIPYPAGLLITSTTDLNGNITHANEAFVRLSGWTREELIGTNHAILRHPDMPAAAFADLWNTIQKGEKWHGYVKNLRKDGDHYWVYATVIPNVRDGVIRGYTSVRRQPSLSKIAEAEALYQTMRQAQA